MDFHKVLRKGHILGCLIRRHVAFEQAYQQSVIVLKPPEDTATLLVVEAEIGVVELWLGGTVNASAKAE